jgi:translation initiation factor IF-2
MSEGKSINLLKAAKELNIGLSTAVEFLGKKGYKVDPKPNTKLDEDMYDVLLKEYQGDKNVKEEAKQIAIGKIRREDMPPLTYERQEPKRSHDFEQEEILIKNAGSFGSAPAEKPKPAPVVEEKKPEVPEIEEKKKKPEEEALPGVKVIGKINLDSLNTRTRPDKKPKEDEKP